MVNGLNVCQLLGIDANVYAGMLKPLVREQVVAGNVHGESGLDGPVFGPLHRQVEKTNAVNYIIDTLMASEGDITLVLVGPSTNIAVTMRMEPLIIPKIKEIVLMGGAYGTGNFTPSAEFNIFADPEAAHVVFTSGTPIVMMGLDLTNQTLCTLEIIERIKAVRNVAGKLFGDIMRFTLKSQFECFGLEAGPLHDATCVGYLISPEAFETQEMYVEVDSNRGPFYGRTVCDELNVLEQKANAKVGKKIDTKTFWDLVEACIRKY